MLKKDYIGLLRIKWWQVYVGGIAEYFQLDPTLVRLGYVFLTFFTAFAGVIAYFVMWIVIPKKPLAIE